VIVDHRREQVVRRGNGVEIAGKMQVDVFHGNDLGIAAARCTALHAKTRTKRRFAQTHHGLLANAIETVTQTNRCCGLAFARRRWIDRRHQNELAVLLGRKAADIIEMHLRFGVAIGDEVLLRNPQGLSNLHDRLHFCFAGDLNVALYRGHGQVILP
jgi:hypothetical protein